MAAYAAVTSLLQSLDKLSQTDHSSHWFLYKKEQTEVLSEKYTFLKTFLEDFTNVFHEDVKIKLLERMIQEAAHGVEDTIDLHVYDRYVLVQSRRKRRKAYTIFHQNLEYAIEEIGLIQREVRKKIKVSRFNSKIPHSRDTSSQFPLDQKDIIVGLDEDLLKIKDRLIVQSSRLEVVPIIGMGGIGKTTLARRVYDNSLIAYHFYVRAWINVSQEFYTREMFVGILRSISVVNDEVERKSTNEQLAERVYQSLRGRKYLIVLDDMWSIEAWQNVRRSFPDDHNGSRIVLTTRLVDMCLREAQNENFIHIPCCDNFPPNLKKLTLCSTYLQWEDMKILSQLPNLEVLKLKPHAFHGQIWKLSDEEEDGFSSFYFFTTFFSSNGKQLVIIFLSLSI